jgi:hypothetical protein
MSKREQASQQVVKAKCRNLVGHYIREQRPHAIPEHAAAELPFLDLVESICIKFTSSPKRRRLSFRVGKSKRSQDRNRECDTSFLDSRYRLTMKVGQCQALERYGNE